MSIYGKLRDKLNWKNIREIPIVINTFEQLDKLSPEQRRGLGIAFGVAFILILLMIFYRGYSAVGTLKSSIESGQSELNKVAQFSTEYKSFSEDINRISSEIRRRSKSFKLKNFVMDQAARSGITKAMSTGLKEELMPAKDSLQEEIVSANFSRVSIRNLMNFLLAVERSQYVTRVKEIHMKVRNDDNRFLDAKIIISTVLEAPK